MEISIYLARFWGSSFIILGLGSIALNLLGRVITYTEDKAITVSTGYITFLLGLITVTLHNIWVVDLRLAVTVLGWTTLLKGIEKIGFPGRVNKKAQMFKAGQKFWGFVIFLIGVFYFWISLTLR
ncbi:hypothetical protein HYS00_01005 [Candidatus Microgenomates bacterium]|nr:hypothetical protein [Candidatus Microgenomates bacterium]